VVVDEVTDKGVNIITREGDRQTLEADTVMAVVPPAPNTALFEALKGKVSELHLIGDAKTEESQLILGAVSDGSEVARTI
jgi:thioredoxin reductase